MFCVNGAIENLPAYDEGQTCLTQNEKKYFQIFPDYRAPLPDHEKDDE